LIISPKDIARWYPLRDHPVQYDLVHDDVRFKFVPAGRRSGKTERLKRYMAKYAMTYPGNYFLAAPTRPQVKKIFWADMKQLCFCSGLGRDATSETELIIKLPNTSTVHLIGLDTPQRVEGVLWDGGGVDEIADTKPKTWPEHLAPALDTSHPLKPGYKPWCWLVGVPDGLNHYYEMVQDALKPENTDMKVYTWFSSDILEPEKIAAAKRRMSERQYKQEYEASFETATGKIYDDYSADNYTTETIAPHEQLLWFHDFNYSPMSSGVGVRRADSLFILDEIILQSAVTRQSALEFCDRYKDHENRHVVIYGDPAGKAGEKHGHASDYTGMEEVLRANNWKVTRQVKAAAPAIRDRQNAVRAKIKSAAGEVSLFVNISRAPYCHKGLATVQTKKGSTFLEEDSEYQHVTTAIGYCVDYLWSVVYKQEDYSHIQPIASAHRWN
jgi:hypothetical protein